MKRQRNLFQMKEQDDSAGKKQKQKQNKTKNKQKNLMK